jgi:hypothetical protein
MRSTLIDASWKRFIWLMNGLLLVLSPVAAGPVIGPEYTLQADEYSLSRDDAGFTHIRMTGYNPSERPGAAALPVRVYYFLVPPGVRLDSVTLEITNLDWFTLDGAFHIPVTDSDRPACDRDGREAGDGPDAAAVSNAGAMGCPIIELLPAGRLHHWNIVPVRFVPFCYDATDDTLAEIRRVSFRFHYDIDDTSQPVLPPPGDRLVARARRLCVNYDSAASGYPAAKSGGSPMYTYDYVIVTTSAIVTNSTRLDDFVAHKARRGHSVLIVTEDDYGTLTGQSPNGTAEKIRQWLIDNYSVLGIEYVLLIGDPDPDDPSSGSDSVGDVPMKMCWPRLHQSSYQEAPTDYFYADLTGNWDLDGDGYYGEWSGDWAAGGVDFANEVYVGRIPVYSAAYATLDAILLKLMTYENQSGAAWRRSALLPMSYSNATYDGAPLAEQMMDDFLTPAGFSSWTQYQQGHSSCPTADSFYDSDEELRGGTVVRNRWLAGPFGLVVWWGHGWYTSASVGYDGCWDGTLFNSTYAADLDDGWPSFVYQNSCLNGYPEDTANLQYSLLKNGGVATVAATRVSWFNTGVGYGDFDGSTTNSGIGYEFASRVADLQPAGMALFDAKTSMNPASDTRLMNYYDFNLYGDPALRLGPYFGDLDESLAVGAPDLTILIQYMSLNVSPGTAPFLAPLAAADLDCSGTVNAVDLQILAVFLEGGYELLPPAAI